MLPYSIEAPWKFRTIVSPRSTHHVVLLAVGLPAPLEELALDLLLAGVALEARLVVHLPERRAPVLLDRLVARAALA